MIIKHDGYDFHINLKNLFKSVQSVSDEIGYYTDSEGLLQIIRRGSVYGLVVEEETQLYKYYQLDLDQLGNPDQYGTQIQLKRNDKSTKWMNLNKDSLPVIIEYLQSLL